MIIQRILVVIILFLVFVVPIILTGLNLFCLIMNKGRIHGKRRIFSAISLIYGYILSFLVTAYLSDFKWNKPVVLDGIKVTFHQPFSEDYAVILIFIAVLAIVSLILLDLKKIFPPLAAVIFVCGAYAGIILLFFCGIQLFGRFIPENNEKIYLLDDITIILLYLYLYIANFYICAARIIRETIVKYCAYFKENDTASRSELSKKLIPFLSKASGWFIFPMLCLIPLTAVIICICIIGGQGANGIIKAFTETSDWTFSRMISPPPVESEGHYLCTVAVNGHERIVKPTRLGIRHGTKIIVNRQLCTANAFEQLIEDKAPRFHKLVRHIYDKYGYPLSKHITTKKRADIVYIAMKPLEWVFLLALYLFDENPESRIALQYTGRHLSEFNTNL